MSLFLLSSFCYLSFIIRLSSIHLLFEPSRSGGFRFDSLRNFRNLQVFLLTASSSRSSPPSPSLFPPRFARSPAPHLPIRLVRPVSHGGMEDWRQLVVTARINIIITYNTFVNFCHDRDTI